MKRIISTLIVLFALFSITILVYSTKKPDPEAKQIAMQDYKPTEGSHEGMYHDAFSSFLHPYIQKAVDDWYGAHSEYHGGTVDPWFTKILSVERVPDQTSNHWFYIKVEVSPYVLAHISVGRDRITFMLKPTGEVTVEKFEHLESYDISPRFRKSG